MNGLHYEVVIGFPCSKLRSRRLIACQRSNSNTLSRKFLGFLKNISDINF